MDKYADDLCTKYKIKYPTLLSGNGRQLPPRPGELDFRWSILVMVKSKILKVSFPLWISDNPHSSCVIACQDRVWKDMHYQMDAFDDGKFPLGTKCSLGFNLGKKAYCVNGQCVLFDENDLPLIEGKSKYGKVFLLVGLVKINVNLCLFFPSGESNKVENIKILFGRKHQFLNRHRRSSNSLNITNSTFPVNLNSSGQPGNSKIFDDNNQIENNKLSNQSGFVNREMKMYSWGISVSSCSHPCGGGNRTFSVHCNNGHTIVADHFCDLIKKPPRLINTVESCNNQPCDGE